MNGILVKEKRTFRPSSIPLVELTGFEPVTS